MNKIRNAKFTSSEIVALIGDGSRLMTDEELILHKLGNPKSKAKLIEDKNLLVPKAYTYIKTKIKEFKVGNRLDREHKSKPTTWGNFCEHFLVHKNKELLKEYDLTPKETIAHPKFGEYWAGSKDGHKKENKAAIDLKAPYTLESFTEFAELHKLIGKKSVKELLCDGYEYEDGLTIKHKSGEQYYWQLVSNAAIDGVNKAELIIFIPNEELLKDIIEYASLIDVTNLEDFYYIANAMEDELPCLPNTSTYENLLKFEIDIPQSDIDYLELKVKIASEILKNHTK